MALTGNHNPGDGGHYSDHNLIDQFINTTAPGTYTPLAGNVGKPERGQLATYSTAAYQTLHGALALVRAGGAHCKIACVGDSNTDGFGAGSVSGSWVYQLTQMLNAWHIKAQPGIAKIPQQGVTPDSRYSIGSGWGYSGGVGPAGASLYAATSASGTVTFTPGIKSNVVEVYTFNAGDKGTIAVDVDGSNVGSINCATGSGWTRNVFGVSSSSSHVVTLHAPTVGEVYVMGIEAYDDTVMSARLANFGVSGASTDTWANGFGSLAALQAWSPALTIIMLGTNDANAGTSVATWTTNLNAIIDAAQTSGDVLLLSCLPPDPTNNPTRVQQYVDALPAIANAQGVAVVDVHAHFGSYDIGNGALAYADGLHLNQRGQVDLARVVKDALVLL